MNPDNADNILRKIFDEHTCIYCLEKTIPEQRLTIGKYKKIFTLDKVCCKKHKRRAQLEMTLQDL